MEVYSMTRAYKAHKDHFLPLANKFNLNDVVYIIRELLTFLKIPGIVMLVSTSPSADSSNYAIIIKRPIDSCTLVDYYISEHDERSGFRNEAVMDRWSELTSLTNMCANTTRAIIDKVMKLVIESIQLFYD